MATFTEAELKQIQVPTTIKAWCPTVPRAIDLQIQRSADYESLTLNIFRYSYLSGLDGEVPGDDSVKAGRGEKPKANETAKDALAGGLKERPEGTSQLDYVRALATRIQDEGEGAKAIGILGTDPYDALLILKALRRPSRTPSSSPSISTHAISTQASTSGPGTWSSPRRSACSWTAVCNAMSRRFGAAIKRPPTLPCSGR